MKIGSVFENQNLEKRVAITPEIAKKYINLGFQVKIKNFLANIMLLCKIRAL